MTAIELLRNPEALARLFHQTYERLAPAFGYKTRQESSKPWDKVPAKNKQLMIAVAKDIQQAIAELESDKNQKAFTYLVKLMNSGLVSLLQFKDAVGISYKEAESYEEELDDKDMVSPKKPRAGKFTKELKKHLLSENERVQRCIHQEIKDHEKFQKQLGEEYSGWIKRISIPMFEEQLGWINKSLEILDLLDQANAKINTLEQAIRIKNGHTKALAREIEELKENGLNILKRVQYSLEKMGKESTLFLIEQALKERKG